MMKKRQWKKLMRRWEKEAREIFNLKKDDKLTCYQWCVYCGRSFGFIFPKKRRSNDN